jgi:hypothetical protein
MVAAVDEDEDNPEVIALGDVRTAFLQAYRFGVDEKAKYVVLRLGKNVAWKVYKLLGPLYGQRNAPLRWYETFKDFMLEEGFIVGKNDVCIFYNAKTKMKLALHVDDVLTRGGRSETEAFFDEGREDALEVQHESGGLHRTRHEEGVPGDRYRGRGGRWGDIRNYDPGAGCQGVCRSPGNINGAYGEITHAG